MPRTNRLNQPTFVVPLAAYAVAEVDPNGPYSRPCNRDGSVNPDGKYRATTFGARVGALIAALPAGERPGVIVTTVAAQRAIGRSIAGKGRCDMIAFVAATGGHSTADDIRANARSIADESRAMRARLKATGSRAGRAKAAIRDRDEVAGSTTVAEAATADAPEA